MRRTEPRGRRRRSSSRAHIGTALLFTSGAFACASELQASIEWYKPGGSQVELKRSLEACEAISGVRVEDVKAGDGAERELRGPFTSCMRERGWVWGVGQE